MTPTQHPPTCPPPSPRGKRHTGQGDGVRMPPTLKRTRQPRGPSQNRAWNPYDSQCPLATNSSTRLALDSPHAHPDGTCEIRKGRGPTETTSDDLGAGSSSRCRKGKGPCVSHVTSPAPRPTCVHSYKQSEVREMGGGPREGLGDTREAVAWRGAAGPAGASAEREKGGPTSLGPSSERLRGAGPRAPLRRLQWNNTESGGSLQGARAHGVTCGGLT